MTRDANAATGGAIVVTPIRTDVFGDLLVPSHLAASVELADIARKAAEYAVHARARNTLRTYRSAWSQYASWCDRLGFEPLGADPQVVAMYLTAVADRLAASSVRLHLSAIVAAHRLLGLALDPKNHVIARVLGGIERTKGRRPKHQAAPILPNILRLVAQAFPTDPLGVRDRAMFLLGFGAACRRSELVALDLADIEIRPQGVAVFFNRSKTDQLAEGTKVAVHGSTDPSLDVVTALRAWLTILSHHRGADGHSAGTNGRVPLFCQLTKSGRPTGKRLSDHAVARMVKAAIERAGLDPTRYSGHSLRAGLATSASAAGASLPAIMDQGRWKSVEMAKHYVRDADIWRNEVSRLAFDEP